MISIRSKLAIGVALFLSAPAAFAEERDCTNGGNVPRYNKLCRQEAPASSARASAIRASEKLTAAEKLEELDGLLVRFEKENGLAGKSKEELQANAEWTAIHSELKSQRELVKAHLQIRLRLNNEKLTKVGQEIEAISTVLVVTDVSGKALGMVPMDLRSLVEIVANGKNSKVSGVVEGAKEQLATAIDSRMTERDRLLKVVTSDTEAALTLYENEFPQNGVTRAPAVAPETGLAIRSESAKSRSRRP
jgi:hypothetical protein